MKSYDELFELRGSSYDRAMRRFPAARQHEFGQAIAAAGLVAPARVADVPAGGGYLQHFLPAGCTWLGHEPCASFNAHGSTQPAGQDLLPLPWPSESLDAAISLAGVHHIEDKGPLLRELFRVLKPGGRLVLSDVAEGSAVAGFLDGYVGAHNSTGHEGAFLGPHTRQEMEDAGFIVTQYGEQRFPWVFPSTDDMAAFCHQLFDLRTSSLADTREAIEQRLGTEPCPDGMIGMRWALLTLVGVRPA